MSAGGRSLAGACLAATLAVWGGGLLAQGRSDAVPRVTSPAEQFGHDIGADYELVNYTRFADYARKLDRESDRLTLVDIGRTTEGRPEYTAIITAPANQRRLAELKALNRRLALAEGEPGRMLVEEEARRLAASAKAVVWIDGGLHADEVLGAQQLIETIYQLTSRSDPETQRILDEVIVLCTVVNPDGMELVADWYMRTRQKERRSTAGLPRLYQAYAGHDNNRDFYMVTQPESGHVNRMLYREWFPVVVFDHHQAGPPGAVLFAPPFQDPFNYHFDPLIPLGVDLVGAAIHGRLAAEGKPGAVMRGAAPFSSWFNGGLRTTAYFHNQIGILTETIGHPTPVSIPFVPDMQVPRGDVPYPVPPQVWPFRRSVEYSVSSNYAVLDLVARRKDEFLLNAYRMARRAIDQGQRDTWTVHPDRLAAVAGELAGRGRFGPGDALPLELYERVLRDPAARDPRMYVLRSDQRDFLTAIKFANALIKTGVTVHRAIGPFTLGATTYPAGSLVVWSGQPFRAHVLDMFEPQDYPPQLAYPGGPPLLPYDVTGYNLSYSMGVAFDRILDLPAPVELPLEPLTDEIAPPSARVPPVPDGGAYLIRPETNDALIALNRLLSARVRVARANQPLAVEERRYPAGTFVVPATASATSVLERIGREKGVVVETAGTLPARDASPVRAVRIGVWDQYGGSIPAGWLRWLLEQFEVPFQVVYPQTLDAGRLSERFDVLVFVDDAIPARDTPATEQPRAEAVPREYRGRLGRITVASTVPQLARFVEEGGTVIAIGSSTVLARHLGLPVANALQERAGTARSEQVFIPGALLEAHLDTDHPLTAGLPGTAMLFVDNSPAFRLLTTPGTAGRRPRRVAWFAGASPLRSGWALGQAELDQTAAVVDVPLGKGRVILFGPDPVWRAQTHGTFRLLLNALYALDASTSTP